MRTSLYLPLSILLGSLTCMVAAAACDSSSDSPTTTPPGADGSSPDGAMPSDDGATGDASSCNKTPPSGFTTVAAMPASDMGDYGNQATMTVDENGDPMVAFVDYGPSGSSADTDSVLYFTRWDRCTGTWTAPLNIDVVGAFSKDAPSRQVAITRDAMTNAIGIAFVHIGPPPAGFVNNTPQLWVASSTDGGKTFTKSQVSEHSQTQEGDIHSAGNPGIAMYAGTTFLAYGQNNMDCDADAGFTGCNGVYAEGTPTAWKRSAIPNLEGGFGVNLGTPVAVALDSAHKPGVAYLVTPATMYNTQVAFWRPGTLTAVKVADTNNGQNDDPTIAMTFDGLAPRIATLLAVAPAESAGIVFIKSADGVTWDAPLLLPTDKGDPETEFVSITASSGKLAVSANGGNSGSAGTCGGPKVARSTNGTDWTTCGADTDKTHNATSGLYLTSAFDAAGKLLIAFKVTDNQTDTLPLGVALWHEP